MNIFLIQLFILCFISCSFGMEEEIIEMDSFSYQALSTQSEDDDSDQRENLYILQKPVLKILMEMLNENFEKDRLNPKIEKTNIDKTFLNFRLISKAHWAFSLDFAQCGGEKLDVFLEKRLLRSLVDGFRQFDQDKDENALDVHWSKAWNAQTLGRFYTLQNQGNKILTDKAFLKYSKNSKLLLKKNIALTYAPFLKSEDTDASFVVEILKKARPELTKCQKIFNYVAGVGTTLAILGFEGLLTYWAMKDMITWGETWVHSPIITSHLSLRKGFEKYASFFQVDFKKNVLLTTLSNRIFSQTLVNPFLGVPHVPPQAAWVSFTTSVLCKTPGISKSLAFYLIPCAIALPVYVFSCCGWNENFPSLSTKKLIVDAHDHPLQIELKRFFQQQQLNTEYPPSSQKLIEFVRSLLSKEGDLSAIHNTLEYTHFEDFFYAYEESLHVRLTVWKDFLKATPPNSLQNYRLRHPKRTWRARVEFAYNHDSFLIWAKRIVSGLGIPLGAFAFRYLGDAAKTIVFSDVPQVRRAGEALFSYCTYNLTRPFLPSGVLYTASSLGSGLGASSTITQFPWSCEARVPVNITVYAAETVNMVYQYSWPTSFFLSTMWVSCVIPILWFFISLTLLRSV